MYVEQLQKSSHALLAHWCYFKCDELEDVDWKSLKKTKKLRELEPEQVAFIQKSVRMIQAEGMSTTSTCGGMR